MTPISESLRGDTTAAVERVAAMLRAEGAPHPCAGALALAARGLLGVTRARFAERIGVPEDELLDLERGATSIGELPPPLVEQLARQAAVDLVALCDLERQWRRGSGAPSCAGA